MSRDLIVGLDSGTSVSKAVAFDLGGRQLAETGEPNLYRRDNSGTTVEQDMVETWRRATRVLRALGDKIENLRDRIAALAVTGQGDGTWLIDDAGEPVAPAWLWLDSRAAPIVEEFAANGVRSAVFRFTGCGMNASNQSGHLVWLKRERPEILERSATALHCKDWLYYKLTGVRATDPSEGVFTFGDFRSRAYADEVTDALGLAEERRLLPELVDGTLRHDPLTTEAAAATGLAAGTPVVLGYVDVVCSALGGGLYTPNGEAALTIVGSTGMHMTLAPTGDIVLSDDPSGYSMSFPVPGMTSRMQSNMAGTLNIDWIVDLACEAVERAGYQPERRTMLAALDGAVLEAAPGAALYHPYIDRAGERGPFFDVRARAQFFGLSNAAGLGELVRSVYEGLGFAARDCYGAMGCMPGEIRVAGGAARSTAFKHILASVLERPVRESNRGEAGAAGAAMIASVAIGAFSDMDEACRRWVEPTLGETIAPDPGLKPLYDGLFDLYLHLRRAAPPHWARLAETRMTGKRTDQP